jgi:hypothetical protein
MAISIKLTKIIHFRAVDQALLKAAGYPESASEKEVIFEKTYCKIVRLSGNKEDFNFKLTKMTAKDGVFLEEQDYSFKPDLNGENFIAQAYNHLKTLPEFSDSTDC